MENIIKKIDLSNLLNLVNIIKKDIKEFYIIVQSSNVPHSDHLIEFNKKLNKINLNLNSLKILMLNNNNIDNNNSEIKYSGIMDGAINDSNIIISKKEDKIDADAENNDDEYLELNGIKNELRNSIYEIINISSGLSDLVNKNMHYNQLTISFIINLFNKDYNCDYNKNASYNNKNLKKSVCLVKDIKI
ncbi:MAG: hypothetical protein M1407_02825 [Deltaproteobacteria bacterium]|nr:hypothetical protein [Deltaproteobacteria bacterium]